MNDQCRFRLLTGLVFALILGGCASISVHSNGLASTPPMGWNGWNTFGIDVDDVTVRAMADQLVASGMRDAGYVYVNIDDGWQGIRGADGFLVPNKKFPNMHALADYIHNKGLKFGIYSSPGRWTCAGYPGSYGHEKQDAAMFASWGIDYLKYDWCSASNDYRNDQISDAYAKMAAALRATNRPIVYSLSEYGLADVVRWAPIIGANLWRTTDDIHDSWNSILRNIESQAQYSKFATPGHWNDPDMLEVGGQLSDVEYQSHMSLWALASAPLLASNDLRTMSPETMSILMNKEVIAIDQDPLGSQAVMSRQGSLEFWGKPLADGGAALGILNLEPVPKSVTVEACQFQLSHLPIFARDLWKHQEVLFVNQQFNTTLPAHGILLLRTSAQ